MSSPSVDFVAPLLNYLKERHPLSDEHAAWVRERVIPVKLKRGECLQRAGELAESTFFVVKGMLRSYVLEEDGHEHTLRFAAEGWWLGDPESARTRTPTQMFFEAIEPSAILRLSYRDHEWMMERIPGHAIAFAKGMQRMAASREQWILGTLTDTAEERYWQFLARYPDFAARVPQRMIASYLGLAPETLSRVRRQIIVKGRRIRLGGESRH